MQACMVAREEEQVRKCQSLVNYGETEDAAKMKYSKMALIKRGPSSRQPNAKARMWSVSTAAEVSKQ